MNKAVKKYNRGILPFNIQGMKNLLTPHIAFKKVQAILDILCIFFVISGCQDPYFNADIDASEKIPVFNATLTNIDKLNEFELYWASPYTENKKEKISGATITISGPGNTNVLLNEVSAGVYQLAPGKLTLTKGAKYQASVILPDGQVLKSEPMPYYDSFEAENLFYDFNLRTYIRQTAQGEFNKITEEGIFIYANLPPNLDTTVYYRVNANYYVHSEDLKSVIVESTESFSFYEVEYVVKYDTLFDVFEGYTNNEFPEIGKINPAINYSEADLKVSPLFLQADRDCINFSQYTQNNFIEWIVPVDIYRNNYETFNYYEQAKEQLEASSQIYDPIPEQLIGNLYNETQPDKPVLGLFDVSAVHREYIAVYVHVALGYRSYQSKVLTDTVIKQGRNVIYSRIDTLSVDTVPIIGN